MSTPLAESDIIFPHLSNTPNLSTTLSSLRRSTLSTHNRLNSILSDSAFVTSLAEAYGLPLVANERCGSWYIPPNLKSESVYFKSTDGHMGEWGFSLRRLNLQLLDLVSKRGGTIIVDSTRRGKSMPDALSKTVPIWCCVLNRAIFEKEHKLYTPPQAVGESEHAQIEARIDGFVKQFLDITKSSIVQLREKLQKPLRPIWVTQNSSLPDAVPTFLDFHPIVLCTASRRVQGAEASENGYIQGAADDHEAWSHGLTPTLFWPNKDTLMSTSEQNMPKIIAELQTQASNSTREAIASLVKPTTQLFISSSQGVNIKGFKVVVDCCPTALDSEVLKSADVKHYLHLKCQTGKLGSRDLRIQLPQLFEFLGSIHISSEDKILVFCPTGKDLSVGTALAILCSYTSETGVIDTKEPNGVNSTNKSFIKERLSWITTSNPALNPSRATLQSVNAVLFDNPGHLNVKKPQFEAHIPIRETRPLPQEPSTLDTPSSNNPPPPKSPPKNIPETIFTNLTSSWTFTRTLRSKLPTHPSGTVTGTATLTPCASSASTIPTLLYAEEGEFATENGLRFAARRKYVYQLADDADGRPGQEKFVAVRFFDDEKMPRAEVSDGVGVKGQGIGGLFVEMGKLEEGRSEGKEVMRAKNREQHLCAEDLYTAGWTFGKGMTEEGGVKVGLWWEVRYDVKGPKKDYYSETRYEKA